ncbi:hypothetical protein PV08_05430 [Exophiala spinifera]|uniref:Enoyl reductase (ER) domain-containing protein n=1 Tax=Exophiala spinifera TaxID=91928 RepID=A0A0D2BVR5_9EURO|nr:uncharacterized protein PV08_05430 [Exophiala spinifera]KIW15384.1 hypothetical protein PV08_05430 [Exophiala spinifera]
MHVAQVEKWGEPPKYTTVATPDPPDPASDDVQIKVTATAIHNLVRLRASGTHYSAKTLPHVPGVDGVGTTTAEGGEEAYFFDYHGSSGTFADLVTVPKANVFPLPAGADPIQVAALVNPAMSSWLALRKRAFHLPPGFSVLILGATSTSGRLAIPIARALGAGKIVGCARSRDALDSLRGVPAGGGGGGGLDSTLVLRDPVTATDFASLGHVDVVLDYVYGPPAEHLLHSVKALDRPTQYINIGGLAGATITLHSRVVRSSKIVMLGSGIGSWTDDEIRDELPGLLRAIVSSLPVPTIEVRSLRDVETVWGQNEKGKGGLERIVLVP